MVDKKLPDFITPTTEDGPLYPPEPIPGRRDLTNNGKANGELMILMGIVSDHRRTPVPGAVVEIWQCDNNGYYDHPRARGADALDPHWQIEPKDLDPNFGYFGSVETDADGIYWFQTVMPIWYRISDIERAAHIHMKVWSKSQGVLTTELYFPGDEQDAVRTKDVVFKSRWRGSELTVDPVSSEDRISDEIPNKDTLKYFRKDIFFK